MDQATQHQVLARLISQGQLSKSEAREIESAPKFWIPAREIISYLGGLIVLIGVVRLFIVVFKDASLLSIVGALYATSFGAAFGAWKAQQNDGALYRLGEVLELVTIATFVVASGLWINELNLSQGWPTLLAAGVVIPWSIFRMRTAEFVSIVAFPVSLSVFAVSLGVIVGIREEGTALPMMLAGLLIVLAGAQDISSPRFMRAVGAIVVLMGGPSWVASRDGLDGLIPVLAIGVLLFAVGAARMWIEVIPTASLVIVITLINFVIRHVDSEVLQGLIIVAVGLGVLGGTTLVLKDMRTKKTRNVVA
jgi:hypothetical protein